MNVENLAVNRISDWVSKCPHLEPYLDQNDRTPLTDGHIDIHTSAESHTNANWKGRVPVQVKGRSVPHKGKIPNTFSLKKADLEAHAKNSGVLYFVVFVEKKSDKRKCFYAVLNPFKIEAIIDDMKLGQKTVGVQLKPFPKEPSKIEQILDFAFQTRSESLELKFDPKVFGNIEEITLYTDGTLDLDAPVSLTRAHLDFSVVIKTAGGMSAPVNGDFLITPRSYIGETTDLTVSSGDFAFHHPTRRRVDPNTIELKLSEGLLIRRPHAGEGGPGAISLTLCGNLEDRFNDLGFMLACTENCGFKINDHDVPVEIHPMDKSEELQKNFEYIRKLRDVLRYLGADPHVVELDALEKRRQQQLIQLYETLVAKTAALQSFDRQGRVRQPVGDWSLELLVVKDVESDQWKCHSLFDPGLGQQFVMTVTYDSGEPKAFRVTPYDVLEAEFLPYTLNLRLDNLVDAYEHISAYPETTGLANQMVLRLIHAADKVAVRKTEFLDAANRLNDWLISKEGETAIHLINRWQIVSRTGSLSQDERRSIRVLKRSASQQALEMPIQVETACAILLGDQEDIDYCFGLLSEQEQENVRSWPIWRLWRGEEALVGEFEEVSPQ